MSQLHSPKRWLSLDSQLELIESRGMRVADRERATAHLASVGYYRLSGYWYPLRKLDKSLSERKGKAIRLDEFVKGSCFETVIELHNFDRKLRALCLDALELVELSLRVDIAHILGRMAPCAHEIQDYFDIKFVTRRALEDKKSSTRSSASPEHVHEGVVNRPHVSPYETWYESYQKTIENRKISHALVSHHLEKYGCLPIWVAIEILEFGMLSKLLAGMRNTDIMPMVEKYGARDPKQLKNWSHSLTLMRNTAAHHSRLWNASFVTGLSLPKSWRSIEHNRCFAFLCLLKHLLSIISPDSDWASKVEHLIDDEFPIAPSASFSLTDIGIPDVNAWKEEISWNSALKK